VCKSLVEGIIEIQGEYLLKCRKYNTLDLSYLTVISVKDVGLQEIPKWLKQCHNLRHLELDQNELKEISKNQFPQRLTHLSLQLNVLTSVDVSTLHELVHLTLSSNKLSSFTLGVNRCLLQL
jgi:Leucine-rich repeat (LRR) protein